MAFDEAAMQFRHEAWMAHEEDTAFSYCVWEIVGVMFALRVIGLRTELYKMAAEASATLKMLLAGMEFRQDMTDADDMVEVMEMLGTHLSTQLMNGVANIKTSNAGRKENRQGGGSISADSQ